MSVAYNPRGLLERWHKADGTQIAYSYDLLGQLNAIAAPDQDIGYDYDAAGRRTMMSDQTGKTSYQYDPVGRPTEITLSTGETVGYSYSPVGNRSQLIYPDGKTVNYDYNKANQLTKLTDWNDQVTSYRYDQNGRLNSMILPNGIYTTLRYDAAGHLKNLKHSPGFTLSSIASYWYEYDGTGRRTAVHEQGRKTTYDYDPLYRLTYVVERDEESAGESGYGYDAAGNRLFKYGRSGEVKATYDEANQLTSLNGQKVNYDKNGNLINDGRSSYSYDSLDRLTRTSSGDITTYVGYTGDGDRIWQETNRVKSTFTLDLASGLTQVLGQQSGESTTHFLPGIGQQTDGQSYYYQADALGSVRHITGERGSVKGQMRYTPFGERYKTEGFLPFMGFTGEPQNEKTDLTYLRARYYNPSLGRFLTPDSIVPDAMNGQAWNRYGYVYNDVPNLVDPSGHNPVIAGFIFGAGIDLFMQGWANDWNWECVNEPQVIISGVVGMYGAAVGIPISKISSPLVRFALNAGFSGLFGGIGSAVNNHLAGNHPMQGIGRVVVLSALFGGLSSNVDDITTPAANKIPDIPFYEEGVSGFGSGIIKRYRRINWQALITSPIKGLVKGAPFPLANSGPLLDAVVPDFVNDFVNQNDLWEPPDNRPSGCEC